MGYLNNVTGYRDDLLANRAIVKHGNYALLTPDGLVKNIFPALKTVTSPSFRRRSWVLLSSIIWSPYIRMAATSRALAARGLKLFSMSLREILKLKQKEKHSL